MTPLFAAAGTLFPLFAQAATPVEGPPAAAVAYRVGPGDVLEVSVEGRPDLSRLPTVQTTGSVWLPRAGEVAVAGLTPGEIASRLAPRLAGDDLPAPRVTVRVKDYQSQFVWVRGEVQRPGRKPLRSGTRLVDALLDAGGFTSGASGEVTIERAGGTFPDGSHTLRVRLSGQAPSPRELEDLGLPLAGGDVLTARAQRWLTVSGEVRRPGRYPLDGPLTLTRAIEAAGGLTRYASDHLTIRRRDGQAGGPHDIEVDLKAIRDGKAEDPILAPDDQVSVGGRRL